MSYSSSSPFYTRSHGSSAGVYGGKGSAVTSKSSSAAAAAGTDRPATLNLVSSGKSGTGNTSGTQQQQQQQSSITKNVGSTLTSTTFATMGSSMMFASKPSRYATPAVAPSTSGEGTGAPVVQSTSKSSSYTDLPSTTASSTNLFSPSAVAGGGSSSGTSKYNYSSSQPKESFFSSAIGTTSSSKHLSSSSISSQQQQQQSVITIPPKSSISNLGYGRTSIPYYGPTKMSTSSHNIDKERESSSRSSDVGGGNYGGGYGHEMHITMNPLIKTSYPSKSNLSSVGAASSGYGRIASGGGGGSSQNLTNLGINRIEHSGTNYPMSGSTLSTMQPSKSTNQLILDSIPNVFCLSCPPADLKFSDAYRAKTLPRAGKENERLIGFATLPEQVHRKSVKKGFDFTLMVVGESGLGKSTLVNSLFLADFYQNRKIPSVSEQIHRTTTIQKHTIEIEERGVKLRLTVVDTPGFGDAINCEESWKTCVDYIDDQFHQYFQAESGLNRRHIQDTRVHCCLYFVPPYGRGLRPLDIEVIRNLQHRVNVIPIIAKSDTLTPSEVKKMKEQILLDLKTYQTLIYQFPECDEEEDEEFKRQDRELKASIPFAVASSLVFVDGKRGRQYPWGTVEIENPNHSDFGKLRSMLIQSHMHDLKETTQDLHYENFRAKAIAQISQGRNGRDRERTKLKRDTSNDSPQEQLLQKEAEIKKMQQMISKMEAKLKAQTYKPSSRDSVIDL